MNNIIFNLFEILIESLAELGGRRKPELPQMVEKVRESWKGASSKKRGLPERRILEYSPEGQPFTPELINEFLDVMTKAGRAENTLDVYRRCLNRLYEYLPDEKNIRTGTINAWTCSLAEFGDYTDSSIEIYCTSANMFLDWCGRADLRGNTDSCEKKKKGIQPELTRKEYHRLLNVAKHRTAEGEARHQAWLNGEPDPYLPKRPDSKENMPRFPKGASVFHIQIMYRQHSSWQGKIVQMRRKPPREAHFRSVLELLYLIHSALPDTALFPEQESERGPKE